MAVLPAAMRSGPVALHVMQRGTQSTKSKPHSFRPTCNSCEMLMTPFCMAMVGDRLDLIIAHALVSNPWYSRCRTNRSSPCVGTAGIVVLFTTGAGAFDSASVSCAIDPRPVMVSSTAVYTPHRLIRYQVPRGCTIHSNIRAPSSAIDPGVWCEPSTALRKGTVVPFTDESCTPASRV